MDWWWRRQLDDEGLDALIDAQHRIVSRIQLLAAARTESEIRRRLRRRSWQTVHPGVYATHNGPIGYEEHLLAGLLYAGPEAAWSHYTAAEQLGLIKPDSDRPVHLTIPVHRRVRRRPNLKIHRVERWSDRLASAIPPRSAPAHAVLEAAGLSGTLDDAAAVVAEACQSGRVDPAEILRTLGDHRRHRHGRQLRSILTDVAAGSHSLLELRYLRDVERAHRLPTGTRQRQVGDEFTDIAYPDFGLVVELDGRFHLAPTRRWKDLARDNRATLRAESTLRYGWLDITSRPCEAAVQVVQVLRRRAPGLTATRCRPSCPLPAP
jgi:very-short-patch-repair endonuclease